MKKIIFSVVALLVVTAVLIAGEWGKTVFSAKGFPKSSTRSDTSAIFDLKGRDHVELATSVYGTDSVKISTYILGEIAGVYSVLSSASHTLILDNSGVSTGTGGTKLLRGFSANNIPGVEKIKIVNTLQNAGDDSSTVNYYNQVLIGR